MHKTSWVKRRSAAERLGLGTVVGLAVGVSAWQLAAPMEAMESVLLGWTAFAATNLVLTWLAISRTSATETRESVERFDQSNSIVLFLVVVSAVVSLVAIGYVLSDVTHAKELGFGTKLFRSSLAVLAIVLSWLLIHARFGFHYAHTYYRHGGHGEQPGGASPLGFPGPHAPDYLDFMYFSYVIGMTSQVSDVSVNTRGLRRIALVHGMISFGYNLVILALSVNTLAAAFT